MGRELNEVKEKLDSLLSETSSHIWILGAGTGKPANLPLMSELTELVPYHLDNERKSLYKSFEEILTKGSNVEDLLSFLIDIKQLISKKREKTYDISNKEQGERIVLTKEELEGLHAEIRKSIRKIIKSGVKRQNGHTTLPEDQESAIDYSTHKNFIEALWKYRGGLEERRKPVPFFTLNYDSTLENALSMEGISYIDGFIGSRTAYWKPEECGGRKGYLEPFKILDRNIQAKIYKLHGSIDWGTNEENDVMRLGSELEWDKPSLIYPDSSKFELFKREPFSSVFDSFRNCLNSESEKLLISIGYSWGDEHVNNEILKSFQNSDNNLTLMLFIKEIKDEEENSFDLPKFIKSLLEISQEDSDNSVLVITNKGFYQNELDKSVEFDSESDLWKFTGLIELIKGRGQ